MFRFWLLVVGATIIGCFAAGSATVIRRNGASHPAGPFKAQRCPAWPSGTGILSDGDFHDALLPQTYQIYSKGTHFAKHWRVSKRTIDVVSSPNDFEAPNGVCSVDLDGSSVGGVQHSPVPTTPSAAYTLGFLFSGNGCPGARPTIKTMRVDAGEQTETLTWDTSNNNDAKHGDYQPQTFNFVGTGKHTEIHFTSLDKPRRSSCGPVIAAVSVTQN